MGILQRGGAEDPSDSSNSNPPEVTDSVSTAEAALQADDESVEGTEGSQDNNASLLAYFAKVDRMDRATLVNELAETRQAHEREPTDVHTLQLAYVLSRTLHGEQDLAASHALLKPLDQESWPVRNLLLREILLQSELYTSNQELKDLQSEVDGLKGRLDALKRIDEKLSEDQNDLEQISP